MANSDIPMGGKYPSRQELNKLFGPVLGTDTGLSVDRRKLYGKRAGRIFNDEVNQRDTADDLQNAGQFLNPQSYDISQTATEEQIAAAGGDQYAFVEWDVPTSSTNYQRPRTVAAGYDSKRQVMTVVFRDGTFYNYYEVEPGEWLAFHASFSKGKPWLNRKNSQQASDGLFINKPRGDAGNMEDVDPAIRAALYRVARTTQQQRKPKAGKTFQRPGYRTPEGTMVPIQNRRRADINKRNYGVNPHKDAGKAPKRRAS